MTEPPLRVALQKGTSVPFFLYTNTYSSYANNKKYLKHNKRI